MIKKIKNLTIPKGAIFDQDGLLFDTEVIFERCWIKTGREFGLPIDSELTRRLMGCGRKELAFIIGETFPGCDSVAVVDLAHRLAAETQLAMKPVVKPGVNEILAFCRSRGIRTAIASSSMRHLVDHNLAVAGIAEFFDAVVTGRDVANGKPSPDIFLLAAERIGISPSECVVFEDAFTGIHAAHAAGCRPVLIPDRRAPTPEILEISETYPTLSDAIMPVFGSVG
jgi:HAD superfamily hydrolase (TIGR01509 family)